MICAGNKAPGLGNLSDTVLKDGATVSAKLISQICNLSIEYSIFPSDCKKAKLNPLFKMVQKQISKIIVPSPYSLWFRK